MINPAALIIVMGTIVALVAIQRALTRIEEPVSSGKSAESSQPPSTPPKPRGLPLMQGLSVTGVDDRGVNQLKGLINKGETESLAVYLASHRPGIIELDEYIEALRHIVEEARTEPELVKSAPHRSVVHKIDESCLDNPNEWAITWRAYVKKHRRG